MLLPVPEDVVKNVIKSMTIVFDFEVSGRWDAKVPLFYMIDRSEYLESYATGFDVRLKTPAKITPKEVVIDGDRFSISKAIIATGYSWRMNERDFLAQTVQYYIEGVKVEDPQNITFYFFNDLIGYAWVFPYGDKEVKVGIGGLDVTVDELKARLEKLIEKIGLKDGRIARVDGAPIDMGGLKIEWAEEPTYVVGEAIGAVMPLTGEGIRPSVMTAKALSHVLLNGSENKKKEYKEVLKELSIYKASKQQAKILRKLRKSKHIPEIKSLSPKLIELIYHFGLGEAKLRDFLSVLPSSFSLIKSLF